MRCEWPSPGVEAVRTVPCENFTHCSCGWQASSSARRQDCRPWAAAPGQHDGIWDHGNHRHQWDCCRRCPAARQCRPTLAGICLAIAGCGSHAGAATNCSFLQPAGQYDAEQHRAPAALHSTHSTTSAPARPKVACRRDVFCPHKLNCVVTKPVRGGFFHVFFWLHPRRCTGTRFRSSFYFFLFYFYFKGVTKWCYSCRSLTSRFIQISHFLT